MFDRASPCLVVPSCSSLKMSDAFILIFLLISVAVEFDVCSNTKAITSSFCWYCQRRNINTSSPKSLTCTSPYGGKSMDPDQPSVGTELLGWRIDSRAAMALTIIL